MLPHNFLTTPSQTLISLPAQFHLLAFSYGLPCHAVLEFVSRKIHYIFL